ncbi:MAG: GDP-mannose 4,6-dehydratase [Alphaproteobacteria bacterium]|nr:GDP-mannose 4,6-dehydratase [Alphaproteobacteria bacterium]
MSVPIAFITGITGQDGAILADILLHKGYEVHGMRPYSAVPDGGRISHLKDLKLHYGDMTDAGSLTRLIEKIKPDEIYNMAGLSHVHASFDLPEVTAHVNGIGPLRILETLRLMKVQKDIRFYQASSSEMFGNAPAPQNEQTPFSPCSPYGAAKLYAHWIVKTYRDAYGLYAVNGILFNHESSIRGEEFVTRKITKAVCEIEAGIRSHIELGNLNSQRDWGHAKDYMEGAWLMLQQEKADDYVLATGKVRSVRDFVVCAFSCIEKQIIWEGEGISEIGRDKMTGNILVKVDRNLFRPKEVNCLLGDSSKAKKALGWLPKIPFNQMVEDMMKVDCLVKKVSKSHEA